MGLASSQARLLSITARLTDNEYRTQRLTNARLKLTDISDAARIEYQNALDSDKFVYTAFGSTGEYTATDLTPAVLYQYQPSKNQYAIVNQAGNIMVSSIDAKNFRETDNLAEFLKRYDCLDSVKKETIYIEKSKYEEWQANQPDKTDPVYWTESVEGLNHELYDKFILASAACLGSALSSIVNYTGAEPYNVYSSTGQLVVEMSEKNINGVFSCTAYDINGSKVWSEVIFPGDNNRASCFVHVMAHMLTEGYHEASTWNTGNTVISGVNINESYPGGHWWHDGRSNSTREKDAAELSNILCNDAERKYLCCGDNKPPENYREIWADACKIGGTSDNSRKIVYMSDYFYDKDGELKTKTIERKMVDLYKLYQMMGDGVFQKVNFNIVTPDEVLESINHFMYHDLVRAFTKEVEHFDESQYEKDLAKWNLEQSYYGVNTKEIITVTDPEKAQWYTNLWYRMNGMDEPEKIYKDVVDVVNDRQEDTTRTDYLLELVNLQKQTYFVNYDVLDSHLQSSKDWLNNALAQGWVTLQKVGASRTTAKDKFKWSDIIYSNASDITLTQDDNAIAKAEAKYTQALREVNSKDKAFEGKIRKLDTEHNALQTEYNSVKAAMDKNIERSFKAFQG